MHRPGAGKLDLGPHRRRRRSPQCRLRAGSGRAGEHFDSLVLRSLIAVAIHFRSSYFTGIMRCA
ncbi:hypothetical protein BQ8482_110119 [Mesorhizobium delmotii]|uniref:Uncharacterized protein n=1 Tax=Mesorhizobium delmotii TaxID=1631247 RepID=A0A2P9AAP4_9HYPH|nr:hypothetical protein BQ8482_110119 [Mesorhizobium delmotii]